MLTQSPGRGPAHPASSQRAVLAVIRSGPVQAPGPPTTLHTVRGFSLTVSPPGPASTPLLPSPVQMEWLAASRRRAAPGAVRHVPKPGLSPKSLILPHFTLGLPTPRTLSFYHYRFDKWGIPPRHERSPPCPPPQAGASMGPGITRQGGPVGTESDRRGLTRSTPPGGQGGGPAPTPRPSPGARPPAAHAPGPLCLQSKALSLCVSAVTRDEVWGSRGGRVATGRGRGRGRAPHQALAGGQVLQRPGTGLQGGVLLALAHEIQVGADGIRVVQPAAALGVGLLLGERVVVVVVLWTRGRSAGGL